MNTAETALKHNAGLEAGYFTLKELGTDYETIVTSTQQLKFL